MRLQLTLGTLVACIAFALPAVADEVWQPIPAKADLDYLVDSVHRIGTNTYLVERGTMETPQGPAKYEAPIQFDCTQHAIRMAWADIFVGDQPSVRVYGKTLGHYAATRFASASTTRYGEALLQWACALPNRPERLVNIGRTGNNKLIQIDSHSISRSGQYTSFWTRYDYPEYQFDPPYDAPYDSKREFVTVNCEANRFRISIGYDFTADGAVTDNMIARDVAETPIDSSDDYEISIRKVACSNSIDDDTYNGIGGDTLRTKAALSDDPDIDQIPVGEDAMAAAQSFSSTLPKIAAFKTAQIVITSKSSKLPTHQWVTVIRPKTDNAEHIREIYSPEFSFDRDMLGLVQLKFKINSSRSESRTVYVLQSLTVKASEWKEGGEISFSTQSMGVPGESKPLTHEMNCRVGPSIDATILNSQLIGRATSLDCTQPGDSIKYYYLESLGYLFISHEESKDYGVSESTIDSVSIDR
jgi:predicted transport protein